MHSGEDLLIVSDLHLGPGLLECAEAFYNDSAFSRFLAHFGERANARDSLVRLVVLGDLIDFPRAGLVTNPHAEPMTEALALATLDRVIEAHPTVIEALSRFVGSGFPIDILLGNHDAELIRPALQERLRAAILAGAGREGRRSSPGTVAFHQWIYYRPGLLYAEHGSQYDDLNCFSTVVEPFADDEAKLLERPIGMFLFDEAERLNADLDPCPDHASNPRRYFALAARRRPAGAGDAIRRKAHVAAATVRRAREMSGKDRLERRARYRRAVLPRYASLIGLSERCVLAIDELSAASKPPQRALASQLAHRLRPSRPTGPLGRRVGYLESASLGIHEALAEAGKEVPFYVFGHSHAAQHLPLDFGARAPQYLNAGTWSSIVSLRAETLRTVHPTFVHVGPAVDGSPPVARVLAWNDASGAPQSLRSHA